MTDRLKQPVSFWLTWFVRVLVAGTFLFSAYAKWITPAGFEVYLVDQGLFETRWTAGVFTRLLIAVELALGLAFLQPYYVKYVVAPLIAVLLTIFTVYLGYARFVLGVTENCGCFGEVVAMAPLEAVVKNVLTLAMVVGSWKWLPARSDRWYVPGGILFASMLCVFLSIPVATADVKLFGRFTRFQEAGRVDLLSGKKLIVVADVECPHCREATRKIGQMKRSGVRLPDIYYLVYGTKQKKAVERFWDETDARFPYRFISRQTFLRLLKKQLPTVYLLHEGRVEKVWDEAAVENLRRAFGT